MYLTAVQLVIFAFISLVSAWKALDPEEIRFIVTRCMEDHLPNDYTRRLQFSSWDIGKLVPSEDKSTECFTKCFVTKIGLYDPGRKKFNGEIIKQQWNQYKQVTDEERVNKYADAIGKLSVTEDSCEQVFNAFNSVYSQFQSLSRDIFHGTPQFSKQIYQQLGDKIRQEHQSYFEFCENKHYPVGSPNRHQLCQVYQYKVLEDDNFKELIDCVFKGLRYITKNNELDPSEIKRDFKEVKKDANKVDSVLEGCGAAKNNDNSKAVHYYKCLVQSSIANDFKEAFEYRAIRSQDYNYNLAVKNVYVKPTEDDIVLEVDGKPCPQ